MIFSYRPQKEGHLRRRDRVRRCARWGSPVLLMLIAGASLARSQERLLPIRLGKAYFFPSLTVSHGWDNNVEHLSDEDPFIGPVPSGIGDIQPILRFELPYRRSLMQLIYRGDFRTYSADILKNAGGMSHFVEFTGQFHAGRRLQMQVGARYVDSITSMLTSVPGGEYQYGTQPVTAEEGQLALTYELGATQAVEVGALQASTRFESSATADLFTNYETKNLYFRYVLDSGPQNQIFLSLQRQIIQQTVVDPLLQAEEYRIRSVGTGFRRSTGRGLSSQILVAYASTDFAEEFWTPFHGMTWEGEVNLAPSQQTQLQVRLRRAPLVSFFNVSAYYLNEAVELSFNRALSRILALQLVVGLQRNTFAEPIVVTLDTPGGDLDHDSDGLIDAYENLLPSEGETREDRYTNASLVLVWHASRSMDFSVGYRHQQSRSNVEAEGPSSTYHIYDFESRGFVVSAIVGWQ